MVVERRAVMQRMELREHVTHGFSRKCIARAFLGLEKVTDFLLGGPSLGDDTHQQRSAYTTSSYSMQMKFAA
jgi:hypothetical protein